MTPTDSSALIHGDARGLVPGGHLSFPRDCMDLKPAKEVFQQRADIFSLLVDAVKDHAIFMLDPAGRVAVGIQVRNGSRVTERKKSWAGIFHASIPMKISNAASPRGS